MSYGRDADEITLDIAFAIGSGQDIIETLRRRHEANWNLSVDDG